MAIRQDIADNDFVSGDDKTLRFTITDDGTSAGTPVNITGATITFKVTSGPTSTTAIIEKSTAGGITITDGPNGVCTVALVAADTAALAGDYWYELQVVDASANTTTTTFGRLPIKGDVIT